MPGRLETSTGSCGGRAAPPFAARLTACTKGRIVVVPALIWTLTIAGIVGLLAFDFFFHVRKAHTPTLTESALWSSVYVGIALLFGLGVLWFGGSAMGAEYFAGYVTEEALSVDNLFVFLIIMASFRVPRAYQQKVLLFGIVVSLVARTGFIFLGAVLINRFAWVFYLFGLILLVTAGNLLRPDTHDEDTDGLVVRLAKRFLPTSQQFDGDRLSTVENGKRILTPMVLVMVAIGGTDLLFALDSIPAIFGLTQNVFIVFTATAFSLMGLRQLFFLIDGLLDRLIFLSYGLAAILGFIGVKLILHALHENTLPFINDGGSVNVVEVSTGMSLAVILCVLLVTILVSVFSTRGKAKNAVSGARRHAVEYLDLNYETDMAERDKIFARMCREEDQIHKLPEKYRRLIRNETEFVNLLRSAHTEHDKAQLRAAQG